MAKEKLIIFDTTMRDGEQSPGAAMSKEEKIRIARQLERMRVDVIEAGFPASSDGDFDAVQAVARAINEYQIRGVDVKWLAWALTVFAGLTMVSNFKFYSGKDINLRKSVSFSALIWIAMGFVALFAFGSTLPEMLFTVFVVYACSGYALWAWEKIKHRNDPAAPPPSA